MRTPSLLAVLLLSAALEPAAAQECRFDYITFDRIRLDPDFALATSTRWGILVNTGDVPISLEDDWEAGLWYAESSDQLGSFFFDLLNPFGADLILQPGEAVGDADPLLLAELLPGETFVTNALIATFQFGVPFPDQDFHIDFLAQVDDQIAKTRTEVEIADLGGSAFWVPVSAKRVTCELSPVGWSTYGPDCPSPAGAVALAPYGNNFGSGPPWVAYWSNMPQIGNWAFGLEVTSPVFQAPYIVGLSTTTGSLLVGGCEVLIGVLPPFFTFPGQVPFFQEVEGLPIPDNPGLVGLTLYAQAVVLGNPPALSTGVQFTIGDLLP